MIRRLAPRRLGTDEEATVVEHLTELRHRLLIVVAAIVPAFLLCFAFHTQLIEWLKRPLPPDKTLVTLGVVEPFTTAVKVSGLAAIAIVLPILDLAGLGLPRSRRRPGDPARPAAASSSLATALFAAGVVFAYFVVLPAAITFLVNFDDTLYNVQIRASYYLSFTSLVLVACGLAFEMPIFILALVRIRVLSYDKLRRNRRIGYVLMVVVRDPAADGRSRLAPVRDDPAPDPLRGVDLDVEADGEALGHRRRCSSGRSTRAVTTSPRSRRTRRREDRLGGLGRSRRGRADRGRGRRDRRRRHDRRRRSRRRPRPRRAPRRLRDRPRLRQRPLPHRVRRLRRLRRRPAVRPLDRDAHPAQGGARLRRHGRDRDGRRARVPALRDHDDRRLQLLGRSRPSPPPPPACARSSTSRSSAATPRRSTASTRPARGSSTCSPTGSCSASRRMRPYTCTIEVYRACAELGLPQATHFAESAAERDWLVAGHGRLEPARRAPRAASRRDRDPACSPPRDCSARA